jgi:hypothetical protein
VDKLQQREREREREREMRAGFDPPIPIAAAAAYKKENFFHISAQIRTARKLYYPELIICHVRDLCKVKETHYR